MDISKKNCCCLSLERASLTISGLNFCFSCIVSVTSIVLLVIRSIEKAPTPSDQEIVSLRKHSISLTTHLTRSEIQTTLATYLACGLLFMSFSGLLYVGIKKNKPGCVLSYYVFGVLFAIVSIIASLLLYLSGFWVEGIIISLLMVPHVYGLTVVFSAHEVLQRGGKFGNTHHQILMEDDTDDFYDTNVDN